MKKKYYNTKIENRFYYKPIKFGYTLFTDSLSPLKSEDYIISAIIKLFINNYKITNVKSIFFKNNIDIIKALNNYQINFAYVPALIVENLEYSNLSNLLNKKI